MRRIRQAGMAVLLLVAVLAMPGRAHAQDLVVAFSGFPNESLDPMLGGQNVKFYLSVMFDYLVGATPDGKISADGGIAQRWEVSSDHKRWTFHLRKGVRFHNGDELTSADVKFSILRALGKRSTTGYAGPLRVLIQEILTPAPDVMTIVTKEPTLIVPTYLSRVLSTEGAVLPKKYLESIGDDRFARAPIGSGAYRFVEQMMGSHIKFEAVDSHWRLGKPRYRTVTFKIVPEESTRIGMLRRGDVDVIDVSRDRMKEVERLGFPIYVRRDDAHLDVWWAPPWEPTPMKDKRVREALNLGVDRKEMAATIFAGLAEPAAVPFGLSWSFGEVGFKLTPEVQYPYDPERAKRLLAEAGYASGFPLDIYAYPLPGLPEARVMAEALAGYWEKIGVKARVVPADWPAYKKKWYDLTFPGTVGYWNMANRDWIGTLAAIEKMTSLTGKGTIARDEELGALVAKVLRQTHPDEVAALMRNIFMRMRTEHLGLPLVYLHTPYATSKKITKWNPGSVMYDVNIEALLTSR
ncbi:MAG: ABC transporter substrate-binding protein [Candidatus Rokubacteria bacterium]|nr:ABC transporter substrate-binding protein [Candidatus Rokubacteria bacterium]